MNAPLANPTEREIVGHFLSVTGCFADADVCNIRPAARQRLEVIGQFVNADDIGFVVSPGPIETTPSSRE